MHTHTHTHAHTHTHTCTHTHTHTPHAHTYHIHIHTGLRITTQNGFMNGVTEEGHTDTDVYPDGPLTSGTHSLRRIKTTTQTARMMTRVYRLSVCLYLYISVSGGREGRKRRVEEKGGREGWKRREEEKGGREGRKRREEQFVSYESPQNFQVN